MSKADKQFKRAATVKAAVKKRRAIVRVTLTTAQRQIVFEALRGGNSPADKKRGKGHAYYTHKAYDILGFDEVEEAFGEAHEDFQAVAKAWNDMPAGNRGPRPRVNKLNSDPQEFAVPYALVKYVQQSFDSCDQWDGDFRVIVATANKFGVDFKDFENLYDMDGDVELEELEGFETVDEEDEEEPSDGDTGISDRDEAQGSDSVGDSARSESAA